MALKPNYNFTVTLKDKETADRTDALIEKGHNKSDIFLAGIKSLEEKYAKDETGIKIE